MMYYVLDEQHRAVPSDMETAIKWFEKPERRVAFDTIGDVKVSTVFIVMDHRVPITGREPPLLFETMIFDGKHDDECWRCSTWEQAEQQHKEAVALVRRGSLRVIGEERLSK